MDSDVIVACITAAAVACGWLVTHRLEDRRADKERKVRAELAFVERQIEELYGPLASLVMEGARSFEDLCNSVEPEVIFSPSHAITDEELKTWIYWTESDFLPRNEKVKRLLTAKAHLIDGADFPDSYLRFFDHANSWAIRHRRWKEQGVDYDWRSAVEWPAQFGEDVIRSFNVLKLKHALLLGRITDREPG